MGVAGVERRKVLLVEDEALLRTGLELIINGESDLHVVGSASDGQTALSILQHTQPDIVLLDLHMPVMDGLACILEIRKLHKELPIVVLTTFGDHASIFQSLAAGANGYLLKGVDFQSFLQSLRDALEGRYILPAEVAATIAQYVVNHDAAFLNRYKVKQWLVASRTFTLREQEILLLVHERLSNKEIADRLYFSEGTIKNQLLIIFNKLNVKSRQDAIKRLEELADGI